MKVLFLSTTFPRWTNDGVGNFILALAGALGHQHTVTVLTPHLPNGKTQETMDGVHVRRFRYFFPTRLQRVIYPNGILDQLKSSILARIQLPFFLLTFCLTTIGQARHHDILLCNWAVTGLAARAARFFTKKPYIVVLRGSDVKVLEQGGMAARVFLFGMRRAHSICVVAEHLKHTVEALGFEDIHVTPNGVDYGAFTIPRNEARKALKLPAGKIVLCVGRLMEGKGVRYLVEAMAGLDAQLVFVGDGVLKDELASIAEEKNVQMLFAGRRAWKDLPHWYAAADLFVLSSLAEGRPNVLIEAMATGLACIATDIPATRELMDDRKNGLLVPPANTSALANALKELLGNEELTSRIAGQAIPCLKTRVPSWEDCAATYGSVLEGVLRQDG